MQHSSVSASIYTQAFISIDRLRSICRPFRQLLRATNTSNQLLVILSLIWLWSLLQSSVQLVVSKVQVTSTEHSAEDVNASSTSYIYLCLETWPDDLDRLDVDGRHTSLYSQYYTIWVFSVDYVIPLFCIGCAYSYIGRKLWERTTPGEAAETRDKHQLQSKRKVREVPSDNSDLIVEKYVSLKGRWAVMRLDDATVNVGVNDCVYIDFPLGLF